MKSRNIDIPVSWEIECPAERGKAPKRERVLAAMLEALRIQRDPERTATIFRSGKHEIDLALLDNAECFRALSFDGNQWSWTLTEKETRLTPLDETWHKLFARLTTKLDPIATEYEIDIIIKTNRGIEISCIEGEWRERTK